MQSIAGRPEYSVKVSGASIVTVASGAALLKAVIPAVMSGAQASFSGQTIRVNDATSGMASWNSGIPLYDFTFANTSGMQVGGERVRAPMVYPELICKSGIVVQGAMGHVVTIYYAKMVG